MMETLNTFISDINISRIPRDYFCSMSSAADINIPEGIWICLYLNRCVLSHERNAYFYLCQLFHPGQNVFIFHDMNVDGMMSCLCDYRICKPPRFFLVWYKWHQKSETHENLYVHKRYVKSHGFPFCTNLQDMEPQADRKLIAACSRNS